MRTAEDQVKATEYVRKAIENGNYRFVEGDQEFPKHIWYDDNGQGWFGFCFNSVAGHYKGWPLEEDERRAYFG
jgi:hypothetical protein